MRIVRFRQKKTVRWGCVKDDRVYPLTSDPFTSLSAARSSIALSSVRLCAPAVPSKVVLVGLNYRDHAAEMNMALPEEPVIFLKPPTAVTGPDEPIVYPRGVKRVDYEAELALVIRKRCRNVTPRDANNYILGYTCLNDVTARDLQKQDGQWTRAKSFDSFCPLGPWIETDYDPRNKRVTARLNGVVKQDSSTKHFIFSVAEAVSFISRVMTLEPGDVVSTGTPPGIGPMAVDDEVEIGIEGIGVLRNPVVSAVKTRRRRHVL